MQGCNSILYVVCRSTGDVLEDIGWMLSDLSCELDRMLQLGEE